MAVNGNYILIGTVSGTTFTPFAAVKSQEIQAACSSIEKASATQHDREECIAGRKSWQVTVNYLVLENADTNIRDVLKVGTVLSLRAKDRAGNYTISGSALCTGVKHSYTRGNLATGSFSFRGTGALT